MSKIEWCTTTWNPVTGCKKISPGCAHCYAETIANRFWKDRKFTDVQCHPDRLAQPLRWRKPRMVFVNSMSDLFHEDVPFEFVAAVYGVMAASPAHTFQVLTKRPARMLEFFEWAQKEDPIDDGVNAAITEMFGYDGPNAYLGKGAPDHADDDPDHISFRLIADPPDWPLSNVWLGVSVENQKTADERIPLLLKAPSACAFVSYEPALEAVDFREWLPMLNWMIVGGESGAGARPCNVEWIRSAIRQCKATGTACFVKQLGAHTWAGEFESHQKWVQKAASWIGGIGAKCYDAKGRRCRIGADFARARDENAFPVRYTIPNKGKGGDPDEWSPDLRVREFPSVSPEGGISCE